MAPPVWAYQVDNFQPPPDEELVCSICQAIFCDPVQSPCNHVFCRACIAKWLETNRNCPICRKRTTRSTLQEVVPIVKNMIMKLMLHCHNLERGCKAKFPLESCEAHVKDCQYEMVQCKNRPCKQMITRKDVRDHETNSCPHSYVRCNFCKLKVSSNCIETHNCIEELRVKLREKDEKLKICREKLKKLKEELKNMRESEDFTSDSESVLSISPHEILFNFTENSNLSEFNSEFSSLSSDGSLNIQSSADESEVQEYPSPTRESMMHELEQLQDRINDHFGQIRSNEEESSIEYPRSSSPVSFEGVGVSLSDEAHFATPESEAMVRPAKRRLVTHFLDSTDEDEQLEAAPQPSRKRTLQQQNGIGPLPGPSRGHVESNDSSSSGHNDRYKLKPKSRTGPKSNPVFEKTLTQLEQYNLDSDPEWLPPSACEEGDGIFEAPSSDESSSSESDTSYEVGRTEDLLNSFYESSDSDEWLPRY